MTLLYLLAQGPWLVLPIAALTGVFVAGFNSLMMATGMAPMLGVAIYERFGLAAAFGGAAVLRLAGWLWLRTRMGDEPAGSATAT